MSPQYKPHIKKLGRADWLCACPLVQRRGKNAKHAYDRWMRASLREAYAIAFPPPPPKKRGRKKGSVNPPKPIVVVPVKPVAPVPAPVDLVYPESVVRAVAGVTPRREYRTPVGLQRNFERAATAQPPIVSVAGPSRNTPFKHLEAEAI